MGYDYLHAYSQESLKEWAAQNEVVLKNIADIPLPISRDEDIVEGNFSVMFAGC